MNNLKPLLALLTFAALVALAQTSHGELRCGSSLVSNGAWPIEVEERCGPPDYVAEYPSATVPGLGVVQTEAHWYYNHGPQRFMQRLIFRNGKLARVDTLGYGFHAGDSPRCTPNMLRLIKTEYELIARCGEPISKRLEWQAPPLRKRWESWQTLQPVLIQEWLYDFSNNQFRQVVTLRNGQVVDVESRP
ncbi:MULTISPECIES: DUF2845 domain-containing protein [Marinobacter]|uniref:DUF2845 domain-containing protein n=1 Tax=Marinobacter profundi TaxID=2666256 RepID=A0A2G1UNE9_9GAMM|nr:MULTISPECIES: DUF2845 domain-containing protein [Marinobacter]MBD3655025.1 DUF2845 domain-containing protein [Marinobacter sp.]PHQ15940.1 hypothetical protein CLH61_07320 [Marinobacter profundi]